MRSEGCIYINSTAEISSSAQKKKITYTAACCVERNCLNNERIMKSTCQPSKLLNLLINSQTYLTTLKILQCLFEGILYKQLTPYFLINRGMKINRKIK